MSTLRLTHGKNGVPPLDAVPSPEDVARLREQPCTHEKHSEMKANHFLYHALTTGESMIQRDIDGAPLLILRQCVGCETTLSRPASQEAGFRLDETVEQTIARHLNAESAKSQ